MRVKRGLIPLVDRCILLAAGAVELLEGAFRTFTVRQWGSMLVAVESLVHFIVSMP